MNLLVINEIEFAPAIGDLLNRLGPEPGTCAARGVAVWQESGTISAT
jgi:hypothetical protein